MLFDMEQRNPGQDIVLVRADTSEDVREAFRNYFSDAREFTDLMEQGLNWLARTASDPCRMMIDIPRRKPSVGAMR